MDQNLLVPIAVIIFLLLMRFRFVFSKKKIKELIANGAQIIDVRSAAEFSAGANSKSINIPLDQISKKASQLDKNAQYVLCCASGMRSKSAMMILRSKGFKNLINAGPWSNTL